MNDSAILRIFKQTDALLEGHFELRSKLHSDCYFQCAKVLMYPRKAEKLCKKLAKILESANIKADTVISPAMGGILVGHEMARVLGIRSIFVEKENGILALRRFSIKPGEQFIVAEDVVTRGGRVMETIDIVRKSNGIVNAVVCFVDRSGGSVDFGCPFFSLLKITPVTYEPSECPLCKKGIPLVHPGS
mgnify:CR=1 FL=1